MRILTAILAALLLLMPAVGSAATSLTALTTDSPMTVNVAASVTETDIGRPVTYTVTLSALNSVSYTLPDFQERIAEFEIQKYDHDRQESDGTVTETRTYELIHFVAGQYVIPGIIVSGTLEGKHVEATAPSITITVRSALGNSSAETADIKGIRGPRPYPFPWHYVVIAIILLIILALIIRELLKRRRPAAAPEEPVIPRRPAHVIAEEALLALLSRKLPQKGGFKPYYQELSGILRHYIEDRYGMRAPERTTEEFLLELQQASHLNSAQKALLSEFLGYSDLVKFARHIPTIEEADAAYQAVSRLIEETKEVIAP